MKQARAFFLVLLLLLSGCSAAPQPSTTVPTAPGTAAGTAAPETAAPAPAAPETAAPAPAAPETAAPVVVSPGDPGLPEVVGNGVTTYRPGDPGWYPPWPEGVASPPDLIEEPDEEPYGEDDEPAWGYVTPAPWGAPILYTDSSKYKPKVRAQRNYTRLSEAPMTEFTPMPGLGAVYPYAAARVHNEYYYSEDAHNYTWGFADENGRLLTDGIYSSITPLFRSEYDADYNAAVYSPIWLVKQIEPAAYGDRQVGVEREGVVAMDGSFALPPVYAYIDALDGGFAAHLDENACEVYNNEGRLLFTDKQLGDLRFYGGAGFAEGRFLAGRRDDEGFMAEYWFVDETGKPVLGPYDDAHEFRNGIACVRPFEQSVYGFIDRYGSWVLEPRFRRPGSFRNGRLVIEEEDGIHVYDGAGAEVFHVGTEVFVLDQRSYGFEEIYWDEPFAARSLYDFNGNVLLQTKQNEQIMVLDANTFMKKDPDTMTLELRSLRYPNRGVRIENAVDAVAAVTQRHGEPLRGYLITGYGLFDQQEKSFFLTEDMADLRLHTKGAFCRYALRDRSVTQSRDWMTNEDYSEYMSGTTVTVYYGQDGRCIGQCPRDAVAQPIGGRLRVITEDACTYYDEDGTVVFSYPLFEMQDD